MKSKSPNRQRRTGSRQVAVSLDRPVYERLRSLAGRRSVSRYIATLLPCSPSPEQLDAGYRAAAADLSSERAALEWCEAVIGDIADESR